MTRYILSEDADRDLDGIWDYIAEDNIDAADQWIGSLFDAFDAIVDTPGIGHKREDLTAYPVLFWPVGAYLVIYRTASRPVEIVAVTQGSRDIPAFLLRPLFRIDSSPRRTRKTAIVKMAQLYLSAEIGKRNQSWIEAFRGMGQKLPSSRDDAFRAGRGNMSLLSGALSSASRIASMKAFAGSILGLQRVLIFRSRATASQGFPYHPPVDPRLSGHSFDRSHPVVVFPSNLFE